MLTTGGSRPPHILVATPCYGNQLCTNYFESVMALKDMAQSVGIRITVKTIGNESLITRARNFFINMFLTNKEYTHLLFIDADIGFDPRNILRMLNSGRDIAVCPYPKKGINWERIQELAKKPDMFPDLLQTLSASYVVNFLGGEAKMEGGFIQCAYGGTGCMMIQRKVVDKLVEDYQYTKYTNDVGGYDADITSKDNFYTLFDCFICPQSNRYLSEDYAFCDRAIKSGFTIWADLNAHITHLGSHPFLGHFGSSIVNMIKEQKEAQAKTE